MMDAEYVKDMPKVALLMDFPRGVRLEMHVTQKDGSQDYTSALERLKWQVLTLWREDGSPDEAVYHVGPFVKVAKV